MTIPSGNSKNRVQINSVDDLRSKKIKPSDLGNIYVDKNGQEYKLRYDEIKKKVVIIKIIKSVLDGKFVTKKYDNIATSQDIQDGVKQKMGELGKQFLKDKYHIDDEGISDVSTSPYSSPPEQGASVPLDLPDSSKEGSNDPVSQSSTINSSDGIVIESINDVTLVTDRIIDRIDMALKNIQDSNVFNERYSIDDKMTLDDIRRIIKSEISGEFQKLKEYYEDVFKGYDDARLKNKPYNDEVKAVLADSPSSEKLNILREVDALNIYRKGLKQILKAFDDVDYKFTLISEDKINMRTFHERQKYSDGKYSINTCRKDIEQILEFFNITYNNKFRGS